MQRGGKREGALVLAIQSDLFSNFLVHVQESLQSRSVVGHLRPWWVHAGLQVTASQGGEREEDIERGE